MDETKAGIIILAAGASTRLGKPKQLLEFQNKTLISRVIESSINSHCSNITVVLGSHAELIKQEIDEFPVSIFINENWQNGMASSIKCGLKKLLAENENLDAVIILLCDQPFIEIKHIDLLLDSFEQTKKDIIAAEYKNIVGVPALFSSKMFSELLQIEGDKGAKLIINSFPNLLEKVPILEAEFDIDTVEDYQTLLESE